MKFEFSRYILENTQISYFMEILPVGAESLNAKGQTDRHDEGNSRFLQFCESSGKRLLSSQMCHHLGREVCTKFRKKKELSTFWV
jgi:hypothetical protein